MLLSFGFKKIFLHEFLSITSTTQKVCNAKSRNRKVIFLTFISYVPLMLHNINFRLAILTRWGHFQTRAKLFHCSRLCVNVYRFGVQCSFKVKNEMHRYLFFSVHFFFKRNVHNSLISFEFFHWLTNIFLNQHQEVFVFLRMLDKTAFI